MKRCVETGNLGEIGAQFRQRLDVGEIPIEVSAGKMIPYSQFDVTTSSDNLTQFTNNSIIFNPTVGIAKLSGHDC